MRAAAWPSRAFEPQDERDFAIERIEGRVPAGLRGTFYRIGPSTLAVGEDASRHWFDGDGMICAFRFDDGKITFKNRFVDTPWYAQERAAGRRLFSSFAALAPTLRGHLDRPKNPANTNVVPFGDRLLALYEAGRPFAVDPRSLETRGEEDFGSSLPAWATFSAHPHVDRRTGALVSVGLGVRASARGIYPVAESWEVGRDGQARRGASIRLRHPDVIHSVGLTPTKTVVLAGPYGLDLRRFPKLLLRRHGLFDCAAWRPSDPLVVYVGDRDGRAPDAVYELPAAFVIHVANAFDDGDDVVVDAVMHPDPGLIESIRLPFTDPTSRAGRLVRLRLGPRGRASAEELSDVGMEFPTIRADRDGAVHRHVYAGRFEKDERTAPTSVLLKVDTKTGTTAEHDLGEGCVFGEPIFVACEGGEEDDGWVLSLGYDGTDHHSFLAILRADTWDEVARLHLPFHVPMGLHASFAPAPAGRHASNSGDER
jgi:all-trans-8'-apo-beta-carotenal 15,15'-oxygenase